MGAIEETEDPETNQRPNANLGATLLRVAWLAILIGLGMEILLLLVASFGESLGLRPFVADFVKRVSWWVIVCMGIAVGTAVSRSQTTFMGLLGLLTAPPAFEISRVLHKAALQGLTINGGAESGDSSVLLALVKGVEYGLLGLALGWVWTRPWGGLIAHLGVGLLIGVIFGGITLALLFVGESAPLTDIVSRGINEILFPVGCALVLLSARAMGSRVSLD